MLSIKSLIQDYTNSARAFSELVPWMGMIGPETILNKDGSLLSCFEIAGVDVEGIERSDSDRYALLVEQALRNFDERTIIWTSVERTRTAHYPESRFDDPVSEYVDSEWRKTFDASAQYINRHFVSILYVPPRGADSFFERVSQQIRAGGQSLPAAIVQSGLRTLFKSQAYEYNRRELLANLAAHRSRFGAFLETMSTINLRQLSGSALVSFLHDRCSPANAGVSVKAPNVPFYLDAMLADNSVARGPDALVFRGDRKRYAMCVSVKDWPDVLEPGFLDGLLSVPGEIVISGAFRFMQQDKARGVIQKMEKHHLNLSKSVMAYIKEGLTHNESNQVDAGRIALADDASDALAEMTSQGRVYGHYNMTITAYGDTEEACQQTLTNVMKVLRNLGFLLVRESMHLLSAWAGCMPGQHHALVRWFLVSTGNVADMMPIRTVGIGEPHNEHLSEQSSRQVPALTVLPTEFSTPFYFNFHRADLAHTLIVGPSRSGKSTFVNFLISQFRKYHASNVYIFDKDYSCRIPTTLQGGQHVNLVGDKSNIRLNPMRLLADESEWPWIAKWLETLLTSRGFEMKAEHDEELWSAIKQIAGMPQEMWQLKSFAVQLGIAMSEQLAPWIGEGQRAHFFDNEEDNFELSSFTCTEMGGLFADPPLARAFMEYAFHQIYKRLNGSPSLIYVEEAWFMLGDPLFSARINDWLRTLAKKNAFLVMATQSLDEVKQSAVFSTIVDNVPNRIFLPNAEAMNQSRRELYRSTFGLNDTQIARIRDAIPKRQYYMVTPDISRMLECTLPKTVVNVVRSDAKAQKVFERHYTNRAANNDDWREAYLADVARA